MTRVAITTIHPERLPVLKKNGTGHLSPQCQGDLIRDQGGKQRNNTRMLDEYQLRETRGSVIGSRAARRDRNCTDGSIQDAL